MEISAEEAYDILLENHPLEPRILPVGFTPEEVLAEFHIICDTLTPYGIECRTSIVRDPAIIMGEVGITKPVPIEENRFFGLQAEWLGPDGFYASRIWAFPEIVNSNFLIKGVPYVAMYTSYDQCLCTLLQGSAIALRTRQQPVIIKRKLQQLKRVGAGDLKKVNLFHCTVSMFKINPPVGFYILNALIHDTDYPGEDHQLPGIVWAFTKMCEDMGLDHTRLQIMSLKDARELTEEWTGITLKGTVLLAPVFVFPTEWLSTMKSCVSVSILYFMFKHAIKLFKEPPTSVLEIITNGNFSLVQFLGHVSKTAISDNAGYSGNMIASIRRLFLTDRFRLSTHVPELVPYWDRPGMVLYWLCSTPGLHRRVADPSSQRNRRVVLIETLLRPVAYKVASMEFGIQNTSNVRTACASISSGVVDQSIISMIIHPKKGANGNEPIAGVDLSVANFQDQITLTYAAAGSMVSQKQRAVSPDNLKSQEAVSGMSKHKPGSVAALSPYASIEDGMLIDPIIPKHASPSYKELPDELPENYWEEKNESK